MSGAAAEAKRLMMLSVFMSLQGVTLGGGGTVGLSCREETSTSRAQDWNQHVGIGNHLLGGCEDILGPVVSFLSHRM